MAPKCSDHRPTFPGSISTNDDLRNSSGGAQWSLQGNNTRRTLPGGTCSPSTSICSPTATAPLVLWQRRHYRLHGTSFHTVKHFLSPIPRNIVRTATESLALSPLHQQTIRPPPMEPSAARSTPSSTLSARCVNRQVKTNLNASNLQYSSQGSINRPGTSWNSGTMPSAVLHRRVASRPPIRGS